LFFLGLNLNVYSQNIVTVRDVFPTQTHDWIDCKISSKHQFKVQKIKHKIQHNRREQYSYIITFISPKAKGSKVEMYLAPFIHSDSSAIQTIKAFFRGQTINKSSSKAVLNDEILITYKSFDIGNFTYYITISTEHQQDKTNFDLNKLQWFVDFVNDLEFVHEKTAN
jgi:hypothetical protein